MKLISNMLAFARSIQVSEGLFYAIGHKGVEEVKVPILVETKTVRGQIANYEKDEKKQKIGNANIQTVDYSLIPAGFERLRLEFSMRILANSQRPCSTNDFSLIGRFADLTAKYEARGGYEFLAKRYIWNLASARWLWRNLTVCDNPVVTIEFAGGNVRFDAFKLTRKAYPGYKALVSSLVETDPAQLDALIAGYATGLAKEDAPFSAKVTFDAVIMELTEVFPSQEFARSEVTEAAAASDKNVNVGRRLSWIPNQKGEKHASMHSQKIGAAIRFVDEWHGSKEFEGYAVSANPYAGVTEMGMALRHSNPELKPEGGPELYKLLFKPEDILKEAERTNKFADHDEFGGDLHFVIANLIRGGVYGAKEKGIKEEAVAAEA